MALQGKIFGLRGFEAGIQPGRGEGGKIGLTTVKDKTKHIFLKLNSYFILTKKERTVAVFLVVSLLIGNSILFIKRGRENFAKDLVTADRVPLDELIEKSDSLLKAGRQYLKVNINTATSTELQLLPGIGRATARRIIEYREKFGPFKTSEDLIKVKGIGKAKYEAIRDCVMVRTLNQKSLKKNGINPE